jgi:hypothetical protein
VKICVTLDHINRGERVWSTDCPIALALKESYKYAIVSPDRIIVTTGSGHIAAFTPRSARRFISRFDLGKSVKPFNFILEIPDGN